MSLNEQFELKTDILVIGDEFAEILNYETENRNSNLVSKIMTTSQLVKKLKTEEIKPEVKDLIISIGSDDLFSETKLINSLCDLVSEIFPNADYYVLCGNIPYNVVENESEVKELEDLYESFYNEFDLNGFRVIGLSNPISKLPRNTTNPTINNGLDLINSLDIDYIKYQKMDDDEIEPEIHKNQYVGISHNREDFDTIYEFLRRFELAIIKTKNVYSASNKYIPDVEQLQIALLFLLPSLSDLEINGIYDYKTINAVKKYQLSRSLEPTGVADFDTNEEIFYDLKIKGFDKDDLAKFLGSLEEKEDFTDYVVDYSGGGFDSEQQRNIELMLKYMEKEGITHPFAQIGILSTIGKESNFKPQNEVCYNNTSNSRIRSIFKKRVEDLSEPKLTLLKKDCKEFFNKVYGNLNGNLGGDDGYNFRGRGFNGITGRGVYKKYGAIVGENLVSDPELLNDDMEVAAKVAVAFFTNGVTSFPEFESKEQAATYFANKNAGVQRSMFAPNAVAYSKRFNVKK